MKTKILTIALISAISVTYSCGDQSKENHDHETNDSTDSTEKTEEVHHSDNTVLVLDDGKLWVANPETTTGVENMVNIMNSFTDRDNVEAYGNLTDSLKTEFTMIFKKCTITGEAHNQLHNFLVPIKNTLATLSSSNLAECQESFDKLNDHLKVYHSYFE